MENKKLFDGNFDISDPEVEKCISLFATAQEAVEKLDCKKAIRIFDKLIESNKNSDNVQVNFLVVEANMGKASALIYLGELEKAKAIWDSLINDYVPRKILNNDQFPEDSKILLLDNINVAIGDILEIADELEEAIQYFDRVIDNFIGSDLSEENLHDRKVMKGEAMQGKANCLFGLGNFNECIKV